ncbi:hypothetical protein [Streptomonospora litoralis]|uniref:Polynucleotide kinase n=1 Tax=Streptomonospora litoralis TaxID=2498135 RepID=A0A4P6PZ97_9ACTN|nr:hypothetical protein [Streptomonospora litoralis]QBI53463.1 hypothetical protein EKD16_08345 [Streptomonospora litoralis]
MTDQPKPRTISVDFDGVIHAYTRGWHDGTIYDPSVPGAIETLAEMQRTFAVVVHTTRDADTVAGWLCARGLNAIPDHRTDRVFWNERETILVSNRKIASLAYIDDRAIKFTSWDQARADIEDLT